MVKRRKVLLGMGSLAAGSAAAIGTGAFDSVEARRGLDIHTPWDPAALLALDAEDGPNAEYVTVAPPDSLSLDFGGDGTITGAGGYGLNDDATTVVGGLFKITNKGTQAVEISASGLPGGVSMFYEDDPNNNLVADNPVLQPGETLNDVGMIFNTDNLGHYHDDITITADATGGT